MPLMSTSTTEPITGPEIHARPAVDEPVPEDDAEEDDVEGGDAEEDVAAVEGGGVSDGGGVTPAGRVLYVLGGVGSYTKAFGNDMLMCPLPGWEAVWQSKAYVLPG
jgi:hypothetical protein